ncbi:ATP-dependent RNA helicase A [Klebsormidium nitens]|uniref:RNA helicase n=1 Tax=Klebsormidium nitens TaxID=105231 RepID=A0A1Y1INY5_KLENI|nr:ATP-dependent RNA helicase A [Klebsormidium nitens]|eukprot:GAQ91802.1 ATP-dependent RNA helicase A [Klebsormidium nitens]
MDKARPNKHAAKAKRHIYSSGAAGTGGKAEPTNAKNGGQPIECPLCDRIFKQDGRLKEHIKNKHADGVNHKTGADALSASGTEGPEAAVGSAEVAEAAIPKYLVKSPKQMLSEWCQKQKRPAPKFKLVEAEGGMFRCRVVIPDPKDSEKDILLWWNEGAPNSEAAQQAAAVAGLHAVAGERRMDRILPDEFREQWRGLDEQAAQRKEREQKQAERRAAAAKRPLPPRRTVQSVFMSEDNRQLVEGLIRDSQGPADTWQGVDDVSIRNASPGPPPDTFATDFAAMRETVDADVSTAGTTGAQVSGAGSSEAARRLLAMGFAEDDVTGAVRACGRGASLNRLVDWLVLNVPEFRLPKQFRPEASGAHVEVLRRGARKTGSAGFEFEISASCREVMERGFGREEAEAALEFTRGNVDAALCNLSRGLHEKLFRSAAEGLEESNGAPGGSSEDLQEERVALAAIYGDDFSELPDRGGALAGGLSVRLPPQEEGEERTKVEFRFPVDSRYPAEAPSVSFRNGSAPPGWLKRLTVSAHKRAGGLLGEPMLWALVEGAIEDMASLETGGSETGWLEDGVGALSMKDGSVETANGTTAEMMGGNDTAQGKSSRLEAGRGHQKQGTAPPQRQRREPNPCDVRKESERLKQHWQRWLREGRSSKMRQSRESLPAAKQGAQLLEAIEGPAGPRTRPRVTIVCGQTGCGKSTQVPQYILEKWTEKNCGGECNVVVTQPRRVAAIGLAERVAAERGEKVGETVGYSVRLESKRSARTRLLFCTTGVLLRRLQSEPGLDGLTHVIVDEVHERTVEGDLMLLLLRTLISDVRKDLTVVLMSATADAEELAAYFGLNGVARLDGQSDGWNGSSGSNRRSDGPDGRTNVSRSSVDGQRSRSDGPNGWSGRSDESSGRSDGPRRAGADVSVVSIPGFTHPVRELYLEDVLEMTGEVIGARSRYAKKKAAGRDGGARSAAGQESRAGAADKRAESAGGPAEPERKKDDARPGSSRGAKEVAESWELDEGENEDATNEARDTEGAPVSEEDWEETQTSDRASSAGDPPSGSWALGRKRGEGEVTRAGKKGEKEGEERAPERRYREATLKSLEVVDETVLNYELVEKAVCKILEEEQRPSTSYAPLLPPLPPGTPDPIGAAGAILVFLPGMAEIRRLERQLLGSQRLAAICGGRPWVLPLHGSLAGEQQRKVFDRPPPGQRKIVLSTNVAETSLTIDDVTYVIDIGRQREMAFDPNRALACLEDVWVSQASARQRRGRAGRARPGCCVRMFSRRTFEGMAPQQAPEVLRTALDQLCLQVKSLLPARSIASVLGDLLTPPSPSAVASALSTLTSLRALAQNPETLTPLGRHLARIPVDVRAGKMLVFGAVLGCPGPAATIAAALAGKSPFAAVPPEIRDEADRVKRQLAGTWKSDHLAAVAAFEGWRAAGRDGGWRAQQEFCQANFLSRESLQSIEASRADYLENLADLGFIPRGFARDFVQPGQPDPDVNALNFRVVKAVLCAGFYPNVVRVQLPEQTYKETSGGAMAKDAHAREVRFYTQHDGRVFLHPASTNFAVGRFESPWLVYSEKVKTSKIFIRESSMVPAYALLLFGGDISVAHEKQSIAIDNWMRFEAPAKIAVLIRELRNQLDRLLADKLENPEMDVTSRGVVAAVVKLLTNDGF